MKLDKVMPQLRKIQNIYFIYIAKNILEFDNNKYNQKLPYF